MSDREQALRDYFASALADFVRVRSELTAQNRRAEQAEARLAAVRAHLDARVGTLLARRAAEVRDRQRAYAERTDRELLAAREALALCAEEA